MASTVAMGHEAPITRAAGHAIDELYFLVSTDGRPLSPEVGYIPVDVLLRTKPLLGIQQQALAAAISRQKNPCALFDSLEQVAEAVDWATKHAASRLSGQVVSVRPHRCCRHEYVIQIQTTAGNAYFKGGRDRVLDEGRLTQLLWTVSPDQFPHTLMVNENRCWWLYKELEGSLLAGRLMRRRHAVLAARALAALQKRLVASEQIERHLDQRRLNARALAATASRIVDRVTQGFRATNVANIQAGSSNAFEGLTLRSQVDWSQRREQIADICAAVDRLGLPSSLVLSDFWGRNVLKTRQGIGFIDLEQSYWGLPVLPLWRFVQSLERTLTNSRMIREELCQAFTAGWTPLVQPQAMGAVLTHLPLLGTLFDLLLVEWELDLRQRELSDDRPLSDAYRIELMTPYVTRLFEAVPS